jgi:hypothetical protein
LFLLQKNHQFLRDLIGGIVFAVQPVSFGKHVVGSLRKGT